jgi:signal transduction histidine kinase
VAGDLPARVTPADVQGYLAAIPAPARLVGRFGQDVAVTGPPTGLWDRRPAGLAADLALVGTGVTAVDGAIEVRRDLANGRAIVLRRDIGREATTVPGSSLLVVGGVCLLAALLAGAGAWLLARRRSRRTARAVAAAEALAAGRALPDPPLAGSGDLARIDSSLRAAATRSAHFEEIADRSLTVLSAAIEPLPVPVAGRGPSGGGLRNVAYESLLDDLRGEDRAAVVAAVDGALGAPGAVGDRVSLSDGRLLEIDGWDVPGGRLVSVAERTEQERLARLRGQIEGSAIRQLRAPLDEIRSRATELYAHLPAPSAPTLRRMFGAIDRLDRVVRMILRGTPHDPAARPPLRETFGVAGLLWGMVHDWDTALRRRALRVELDVASDLPDVRTDAALVEEILTELIDNAAKYAPPGGTIALSARGGDGSVVIDVRDSGRGISAEDAPNAATRFYRGRDAEAIPGAGLGLGVASALAQRLGGRLVIGIGPGGAVRLELPAEPAPAPELAGIGA